MEDNVTFIGKTTELKAQVHDSDQQPSQPRVVSFHSGVHSGVYTGSLKKNVKQINNSMEMVFMLEQEIIS